MINRSINDVVPAMGLFIFIAILAVSWLIEVILQILSCRQILIFINSIMIFMQFWVMLGRPMIWIY